MKLIHGDSNQELYHITGIDTIITDPPYGLKFMGKKWDYDVPSVHFWKVALASCKPGATALVFAGSRTYHRMAVNMEDAGWELKDCIMWLYGSGFPKATDISKQLDKTAGKSLKWFIDYVIEVAEDRGITKKELTGLFPSKNGKATGWLYNKASGSQSLTIEQYNKLKKFLDLPFETLQEAEREVIGRGKAGLTAGSIANFAGEKEFDLTTGKTPEAILWNGWKSHGLKPSYEPIIVAMKPNDGTYANNALKHGVSGLNIDGGRIGRDKDDVSGWSQSGSKESENLAMSGKNYTREAKPDNSGRFPANIILDEEAGEMLDEQSGERKGWSGQNHNNFNPYGGNSLQESKTERSGYHKGFNDKGGASRFFKECSYSLKHDTMSTCKNTYVDNVIKLLGITQVTIASFAPLNVEDSLEEQKDLIAKYVAENVTECEMYTALVLAKIKSLVSKPEALQAIRDSITNSKECTQLLSLVLLATQKENTDITETTVNLLKSFGCVPSVTDKNTNSDTEEVVERKSEHMRFLYCPKASKKERNEGLEGFEEKVKTDKYAGRDTRCSVCGKFFLSSTNPCGCSEAEFGAKSTRIANPTNKNNHPTVKPLALMEYLVRLTATPTGGRVLDPFMGSGTTGIACKNQGRDFIGIELDEDYFKIAQARLK